MYLSRLSLNSLWLLISRVGAQLGLALFTVLLARGLGSAAFGEYAFIAALIVVGNVLTTFGTDMLLIREIASTDDLSQLYAALMIQVALSLLFIGAVFLSSGAMPLHDAAAGTALRIYSLSMLPLAFYTVFTTALRGRQHMLAYALLNLALMLMQVLAALWLLWQQGGLIALAVLLLAVQVSTAGIAGATCFARVQDFRLAAAFSVRQVMPLIRTSAPIAFLGVLGILYQRLSLLLLPALAGSAATGWFSAAARLAEATKMGHIAAFTALYPMMAQLRTSGSSRWAGMFRVPGLVLLGAALIGATVLSLLAPWIVPFLFGPGYLPAVPLARILAWMLVPYALNSFLTLALLAYGEERAIAWALALSLCLLAALTFWWVPLAGTQGAAWAALCAELAQSLALLVLDSRRQRIVSSLVGAAMLS